MSINMTLIGQMITFLLFVYFTKRFVMPHVQVALADRQQKIADGLAAAERGHRDLELAQESATKKIKSAKKDAEKLIEEAKTHAIQIIENAKEDAQKENERLKAKAQSDLELMAAQAQEALRKQAAALALFGAEKILAKNIDEAANQELLNDLIKEI